MAEPRVVLLAQVGDSSTLLYHALHSAGHHVSVLFERPPSTLRLLRIRMRTQGVLRVSGQVLFQLFVARPLAWRSRPYRQRLIQAAGASLAPIPAEAIGHIPSVNHPDGHVAVLQLAPDVVVISGTRILSARTIAALGRPIINMHAGITPQYRGVHGGYWALVERDLAHCGVTVHLVDAGVDTGAVLYQALITPGPADDFSTYPTLQTLAGLPLLVKAVRSAHVPAAHTPGGASRRWYHPTLWGYLWHRIVGGVR